MTTESWRLKGDYFENCNCEVLCPCVVPDSGAVPTDGHCDVGFGFHIEEGDHNGVALGGLSFVVICYTPGIMADGDWTSATYIDEKADDQQRAALARILSGEVGGPAERWMTLTSDFRGIKYCPIDYRAEGRTRSVHIPDVMDFAVEGLVARNQTDAMVLENTGHPVSPSLAMARGTGSTYADHGMTWDNTGKNGHYSAFDWRWP